MEWTDYPRVALVVLLVLVNVGLVVGLGTSSTAYGPANSAWDGGTELREQIRAAGAQPTTTQTTDAYVEAGPDDVAFVLAPTAEYGPGDVTRVRQFVSRGGTLVVAGEGNDSANQLLGALGVGTRLNGTTVRDAQSNYRNASLPRATNVSDHPLVRDVDQLTLNYGTVLEVPADDAETDATVLVRTGPTAYLDQNGNRSLDENESISTYPVAAVERVGTGRVVVVSDASVFTNAMLQQDGNAAFARALTGNATTALVDYSHRPPLPPLTYTTLLVQRSPALQAGIALAALLVVGLWARRPSLPSFDRFEDDSGPDDVALDEDDIAALLHERHPEWDDERIERVSQGLIRQRRES